MWQASGILTSFLMNHHLLSVDLDLFNLQEFNKDSIIPILEKHFKGFTYNNSPNSIGLFGRLSAIRATNGQQEKVNKRKKEQNGLNIKPGNCA
jgi:hypothetical protein